MSVINVTNVIVGKNPAGLTDQIELEVSIEILESLTEVLEWKLIYIGSADKKDYDQVLDTTQLKDVQRGSMNFKFECKAPDFSKIPSEDVVGITVILLTGTYKKQEFIRIGWYIHNAYVEEAIRDNPPDEPIIDKMQREILTDAPRITRFAINWDNPNPELIPPEEPESKSENELCGNNQMMGTDTQVIDPEQAKHMQHAEMMIQPEGGEAVVSNKAV